MYTKGAAEVILSLCATVAVPSADDCRQLSVVPLSAQLREQLLGSFTRAGLRTLVLAARDFETTPSPAEPAEKLEQNLTLLGVVGLRDPLRPEVAASVAACQRAGITVKMLTGDNAATAAHIARSCGILPACGDAGGGGNW